ncbi:TPA: glycosyltransferase, partial [Enterococcus faecium]|nr:glycosyltransferase [Enterococcus faecium]
MSNVSNPLVSVIMGAYNSEKTIGRAIDSIIKQTYLHWEMIICDDGSTDGTVKIIRKYVEKDKRIKLVQNKKNSGLAYSLNHCLKYSSGKYVARMDADDISLPERFAYQVGFFEKNPEYDVVGCNRIVFDENGDSGIRKSKEIPTINDMYKGSPFAHPTIMMKRSVYTILGGYRVNKDTTRSEDLEMWFRFFNEGFRGYNLQRVLFKYQETSEDFHKRSLRAAYGITKVLLRGYKLIGVSKYKYIYAFKPIISAIIPKYIMYRYQERRLHNTE